MTKEEYVYHHLGKHIQADTDVQHHMLIIHLLQEVWQLREDIKEMKQAVEGGTISIPVGLTHEERREWIRDRLEEMEDKG